MCYAIPGKIIELKDGKAKIDYSGEIREADASLIEVKVGDYVIVQAQFVISIVPEKEAKEVMELWAKTQDKSS